MTAFLSLVMQATEVPVNPKDYATSWGVLGALVFISVVLALIVYAVFVKGAAEVQKRTDTFLSFVQAHTDRHVVALADLGDKVIKGDDRLAQAFESNARLTRTLLVTWEAIARARAIKAGGGGAALTPDEFDRIIRASHDSVHRST